MDFARRPAADRLDGAREMAREVVEQVFRANPHAGLDEVNAALERRMRQYNATPQAEPGGLSLGRPHSATFGESIAPMESRFPRPLLRFGLARSEDPRDPLDLGERRWRKTRLLDRSFRFDW